MTSTSVCYGLSNPQRGDESHSSKYSMHFARYYRFCLPCPPNSLALDDYSAEWGSATQVCQCRPGYVT